MAKIDEKRKRPARRTPITGRNVLTVDGKDAAYEYRIVNDVGHRVEMLKERGYEVVEDATVRIGDRRVATPKTEGSVATVHVGGGMQGVVMRIPKEFYEEDTAIKMSQVDDLEAATKRPTGTDYGSVKIERKGS